MNSFLLLIQEDIFVNYKSLFPELSTGIIKPKFVPDNSFFHILTFVGGQEKKKRCLWKRFNLCVCRRY